MQRVIDDEIGRGEGANFVIRRDFHGRTEEHPARAVAGWMRRLLLTESNAYWTFALYTPGLCAVGATPERHVSRVAEVVTMNPISGTLRHGPHGAGVEEVLAFLYDAKESEELVMVVDEELKMMCAACPDGGRMRGPYLKRMSHLTHTEYVLQGRCELDPREILRLTMFAPTVTGSPMGNACTVITRHESSSRGYYSGVLARFTPTRQGYDLDAPILIRTAYVDGAGNVRVPVGATLVRHSDPDSEVAETHAKAAGILTALGAGPRQYAQTTGCAPGTSRAEPEATDAAVASWDDPRLDRALAERNEHLAEFWRQPQRSTAAQRGTALVIDCGDDFTTMLAHQLRHLGFEASVCHWKDAAPAASHDLVVFGPGPGDPTDLSDPRIIRLRELIAARLESGRGLAAVCLSHQVLAGLAGLEVEVLPVAWQGRQRETVLFGHSVAIGYYNTFAARGSDGGITPALGLRITGHGGFVDGLQAPGVASVQGHLESVLSPDGLATLERLVEAVTARDVTIAPRAAPISQGH
ncbi:MAG TPA: chorismate-binding protein [Ruania sp.]|nr:chorismate-binding protein [Ruania sp.]